MGDQVSPAVQLGDQVLAAPAQRLDLAADGIDARSELVRRMGPCVGDEATDQRAGKLTPDDFDLRQLRQRCAAGDSGAQCDSAASERGLRRRGLPELRRALLEECGNSLAVIVRGTSDVQRL